MTNEQGSPYFFIAVKGKFVLQQPDSGEFLYHFLTKKNEFKHRHGDRQNPTGSSSCVIPELLG